MTTRKTTTDKFGKSSRMYSRPDGEYVSVTTVLGSTMPKPFLIPWAAKLERTAVIEEAAKFYRELWGADGTTMPPPFFEATLADRLPKKKAHRVSSELASDIGSRVHWRCELLNREIGSIQAPQSEEPPSVDLAAEDHAVAAYRRWVALVNFQPSHVEHVVYSKAHHYAGCLDARGLVNGVDCLVDLKTGKSIYDDYLPQVSAYSHAAAEMGEGFPAKTLIVRIPKDLSEPECEVVEVTDLLKHFRTFLACLNLWRCLNQKDSK